MYKLDDMLYSKLNATSIDVEHVVLKPNTKLLLLSDIDAVITNWTAGYFSFLETLGFTAINNPNMQFNMKDVLPQMASPDEFIMQYQESEFYQLMPMFDDIKQTLETLKILGVEVHFITSCGLSDKIISTRNDYMQSKLGGLYESIHYLGIGHFKSKVLSKFSRCNIPTIFIDDQAKMLAAANRLGYTTILKDMSYNQESGDTYNRISKYSGLIAFAKRLIYENEVCRV